MILFQNSHILWMLLVLLYAMNYMHTKLSRLSSWPQDYMEDTCQGHQWQGRSQALFQEAFLEDLPTWLDLLRRNLIQTPYLAQYVLINKNCSYFISQMIYK